MMRQALSFAPLTVVIGPTRQMDVKLKELELHNNKQTTNKQQLLKHATLSSKLQVTRIETFMYLSIVLIRDKSSG